MLIRVAVKTALSRIFITSFNILRLKVVLDTVVIGIVLVWLLRIKETSEKHQKNIHCIKLSCVRKARRLTRANIASINTGNHDKEHNGFAGQWHIFSYSSNSITSLEGCMWDERSCKVQPKAIRILIIPQTQFFHLKSMNHCHRTDSSIDAPLAFNLCGFLTRPQYSFRPSNGCKGTASNNVSSIHVHRYSRPRRMDRQFGIPTSDKELDWNLFTCKLKFSRNISESSRHPSILTLVCVGSKPTQENTLRFSSLLTDQTTTEFT